jgi:hypothetical protein
MSAPASGPSAQRAGPPAAAPAPVSVDLRPLHRAAATLAALNAVIYGLIFAGALSVGRADEGELGILGVAGIVYLVLAAVLWFVPRPLVWAPPRRCR